MRIITTVLLFSISHFVLAQFYSGYYVSEPQVHSFDHFKIKHKHDHTKLDGDLTIHAYIAHNEVWEQTAHAVTDEAKQAKLIADYNHGEEIISTHLLKFMWDGNEWEYILLGYLEEDGHRHFIVIEEIFNDASETRLLEFNRFDWVKGHHIENGESH
ncbi:MAG: hypothetical protein RLN88_04740 [Ekhidna sp.]|uniref:hypothetical protein n=1 Tax=Ekhidna sp. TaxID=2608089 RepID=UPI0032EFD12A